jgi:hypothetical protein
MRMHSQDNYQERTVCIWSARVPISTLARGAWSLVERSSPPLLLELFLDVLRLPVLDAAEHEDAGPAAPALDVLVVREQRVDSPHTHPVKAQPHGNNIAKCRVVQVALGPIG